MIFPFITNTGTVLSETGNGSDYLTESVNSDHRNNIADGLIKNISHHRSRFLSMSQIDEMLTRDTI